MAINLSALISSSVSVNNSSGNLTYTVGEIFPVLKIDSPYVLKDLGIKPLDNKRIIISKITDFSIIIKLVHITFEHIMYFVVVMVFSL